MRFLDDMKTNYTPENARLPTLPAARDCDRLRHRQQDAPVFIHLRDGDQPDQPDQPDPSRRPAMREPAIASEEDDILDRLQCLERAVAVMAGSSPTKWAKAKSIGFLTIPANPATWLSRVPQSGLPKAPMPYPMIRIDQRKELCVLARKGGTTTGGSQSLPPSSRKAESGGYLPNATGSISGNRRLSTTAKVPEAQGRTWGTSDRAAMQRADFWRSQRLNTNAAIGKIQQTLQTRWGR